VKHKVGDSIEVRQDHSLGTPACKAVIMDVQDDYYVVCEPGHENQEENWFECNEDGFVLIGM
jgi:hypothetical protein